jgi:hypothetical protein
VWVVVVGGVGEALVEEVAVAVEGDEWVGVAGDFLGRSVPVELSVRRSLVAKQDCGGDEIIAW